MASGGIRTPRRDAAASGLRARCGLAASKPEERAAIYSHNHAAVLFCMLGILRAGAAWVPINFRNAADANVEFLNYSETAWLFYHSRFREQVEEIRRRVPFVAARGLHRCERMGRIRRWRNSWSAGSSGSHDERDWARCARQSRADDGAGSDGRNDGPARGVRVTNLAWGTMTEMAIHYWRARCGDPVCLCTAPLSHAAGVVAFTMFALGGTNVVLPGFDAAAGVAGD